MPIFVGAGTSSFMKETGGIGFSKRTSTEIDNLTGMVSGQVVYDTTAGALKFYDGSNWIPAKTKVFIDDTHLNNEGNLIIAEKLKLIIDN